MEIASSNDSTLELEVHDPVLSVKPDNLKPTDSPALRRQLKLLEVRGELQREAKRNKTSIQPSHSSLP